MVLGWNWMRATSAPWCKLREQGGQGLVRLAWKTAPVGRKGAAVAGGAAVPVRATGLAATCLREPRTAPGARSPAVTRAKVRRAETTQWAETASAVLSSQIR